MAYDKAQLEALYKTFNPAWEGMFADELAADASWRAKLGRKLYNTESGEARAFEDFINLTSSGVPEADALSKVTGFYNEAVSNPFSTKNVDLGNVMVTGADGNPVAKKLVQAPMGRTAKVGGGILKAHPMQALGTAATTAGSLAGLFDNDKIAGQLIGTAAGAAIPAIAGMGLSPLAAYNVAAGAGTIGSLFDVLRAKKADERAAMAKSSYGKEQYVR